MADSQIRGLGESSAPLSYTVPGAQEIVLKSLFASFDGTAAAAAWYPCVRITAPGGGVVGEYITQAAVAAGSSADVSFAPFLRGLSTGAGGGAAASTAISDIAFVAVGAVAEGAGITTLNVDVPAGIAFHDAILVVFAFEGVAAGSGPWISDSSPHFGWYRVGYQAPVGGAGTGLELWGAIWEVGTTTPWNFSAASTVVAREVAYRNASDTIAPSSWISAFTNWTGNNPVCPTVTTVTPKSWVLPVAGQALAAGGFTYPAPYTRRFDSARGGVVGNAEIAEGDAAQAAPGASGTITLTAAAAGGTSRGAVATVVMPPIVTTTTTANTLIGLTAYERGADGTIATGNATSLTAVDATNATVFFTAPDSGNVLVRLSCLAGVNNTTNQLHFGLLDGAASKGQAQAFGSGSGAAPNPLVQRMETELYVSGLTTGTVYGWKFAYSVGGAATTATFYGGPTYGRLVMEVWVAP